MPDDRLFMRLPAEAAEDLYEAFRDQLEGAPGYVPAPTEPDAMAAIREHLKTLSPAELEQEYRRLRRRLVAPAPRAQDSLRALGVGGQHPQAAAINRAISPYGRF